MAPGRRRGMRRRASHGDHATVTTSAKWGVHIYAKYAKYAPTSLSMHILAYVCICLHICFAIMIRRSLPVWRDDIRAYQHLDSCQMRYCMRYRIIAISQRYLMRYLFYRICDIFYIVCDNQ